MTDSIIKIHKMNGALLPDYRDLLTPLQQKLNYFTNLMMSALHQDTRSEAQYDKNKGYLDHCVLNISEKENLDLEYSRLTGEDSFAQQQLQLLFHQIVSADNEEKTKISGEIKYIINWLHCVHDVYTLFLSGVIIDEERWEDKRKRTRDDKSLSSLTCHMGEALKASSTQITDEKHLQR